jgi:hypothetical protein
VSSKANKWLGKNMVRWHSEFEFVGMCSMTDSRQSMAQQLTPFSASAPRLLIFSMILAPGPSAALRGDKNDPESHHSTASLESHPPFPTQTQRFTASAISHRQLIEAKSGFEARVHSTTLISFSNSMKLLGFARTPAPIITQSLASV